MKPQALDHAFYSTVAPRTPLSIWIGLVMLAAFAVRGVDLGEKPLWLDEAYSVWFASRDWSYLWNEVPQFETHPPFYYSLLKIWMGTFGNGEFALRLLSTVLNIATLPFIAATAYILGGRERGRLAAILAAIMFAFSDRQILTSQDARPYALMSLALALMLFASVRIMRFPERSGLSPMQMLRDDLGMLLTFIGLGAGFALMAWSHNLGLLFCVILGMCLLAWWLSEHRSAQMFVNILLAVVFALLLYAPNITNILMQMRTLGEQGFWLQRPSLRDALKVMLSLPMGSPTRAGFFFLFCALLGFGYLWGSHRSARISGAMILILPVMAIVPAGLAFVVSYISQPIFLERTLQSSQVPIILLMAFAPLQARKLQSILLALILVGTVSSSVASKLEADSRINWRMVIESIRGHSDGNIPKVVAFPASVELPLLYYADKMNVPLELYTLPDHFPARGPEYTYPAGGGGVPALRASDIDSLADWLDDSDDVWFISRMPRMFDVEEYLQTFEQEHYPCELQSIYNATLRARILKAEVCP